MNIGIPKEVSKNEARVACTPIVVKQLLDLGHQVLVEHSAGAAAGYSDAEFQGAGASVVSHEEVWRQDMVCKVQAPNAEEQNLLNAGQTLISFIWPGQNAEMMDALSQRGITVMAMDSVPRISRAQKLDALSSMANIAGYRAVIEAGQHFGRFFNGQITAAGKIPPAKVLVIGAGVAGLAAIGIADNLGAVVRAFDTRPEVKEQIESMNAQFLMLEFAEDGAGDGGYAKVMSDEFIAAEMALFAAQAKEVDIIITTALIPGKPAPKLITEEMVASMKPGSVIVDLAAERGGNCELTQADKVIKAHGVSIIGYTDLPSRMAAQSSQLYATNIRHLINDLTPEKDGEVVLDLTDEVMRGTTVIHQGEIIWPAPPPKLSVAPKTAAPVAPIPEVKPPSPWVTLAGMAGLGALILLVGSVAPASFMQHFIVFVLACFVGWQVVWSVTPALHTPLMSVTNAISGIIVLGALLQVGSASVLAAVIAGIAVLIASINIAGGFLVTQRMLRMFSR